MIGNTHWVYFTYPIALLIQWHYLSKFISYPSKTITMTKEGYWNGRVVSIHNINTTIVVLCKLNLYEWTITFRNEAKKYDSKRVVSTAVDLTYPHPSKHLTLRQKESYLCKWSKSWYSVWSLAKIMMEDQMAIIIYGLWME